VVAPSTGALLAAALPAMVPVLGDLVRLGSQYFQVRALEAHAKLAGAGRPAIPMPPAAATASPRVSAPAAPGAPPATTTSPLAPFRHAIVEGDASAYPHLAKAIQAAGAGILLDGLRSGQVAFELLQQQLGEQFPELREPGAAAFFEGFVQFLQEGGATGPIVAVCPACQADYTAAELAGIRVQFGREVCTGAVQDRTTGAPAVCGAGLTAVAA
jgi:hypothetical protein